MRWPTPTLLTQQTPPNSHGFLSTHQFQLEVLSVFALLKLLMTEVTIITQIKGVLVSSGFGASGLPESLPSPIIMSHVPVLLPWVDPAGTSKSQAPKLSLSWFTPSYQQKLFQMHREPFIGFLTKLRIKLPPKFIPSTSLYWRTTMRKTWAERLNCSNKPNGCSWSKLTWY